MKKILVGIDFSDLTAPVLEAAAALALALKAKVYLMHAVCYTVTGADLGAPPVITPDPVVLMAEAREQLKPIADGLRQKGLDVSVVLEETTGNAGARVIEEADALGADLIIVGSHGHGAMYHLLIGSTAELLVRKSKRPVLLIPPPPGVAKTKKA